VMALLELRRKAMELAKALYRAKAVAGRSTICAWCKRLQTQDGVWTEPDGCPNRVDGTTVSHGICPDCFAQEVFSARSIMNPTDSFEP